MNTLFVLAHPSPEKSRYNKSWAKAARESGYPIHVLANQRQEDGNFNIQKEQEILSQYQGIAISFPIQWYAPNWLLQKWLADVLTPGFAYGQTRGLEGKFLTCLISTGVSAESYTHSGSLGITVPELTSCIRLTATYCGMEYYQPFIFYGTAKIADERVDQSSKVALLHLHEFTTEQKRKKFEREHAHRLKTALYS